MLIFRQKSFPFKNSTTRIAIILILACDLRAHRTAEKKTRENAAAAVHCSCAACSALLYPSKVVIRSLPRFVMVFHQDCHRRPLENGPVMAGFYTQIFTILWAGCDLARCNVRPAVRQHQENACTLSLTKGERRLVGRDARRRDWIKVVVFYLFPPFFFTICRSISSFH